MAHALGTFLLACPFVLPTTTHNLQGFHAQEVYIFFANTSHGSPKASCPSVTKVPRKRKRLLNLDGIIEAFDIKPKDCEAAWKDLKARITESYILDRVPAVSLCNWCALRVIGLRF